MNIKKETRNRGIYAGPRLAALRTRRADQALAAPLEFLDARGKIL